METNSHPSEVIALITKLEALADKWSARLAVSPPAVEEDVGRHLAEVTRRLKRTAAEFNSKLFILLVFGPLKSGKSTLVNCLVGSEVSPTALGISTTKRPSIMLSAPGQEPMAEQFFEAERNPETRLQTFEVAIDYLRGLKRREELSGEVVIRALPMEKVGAELRREPAAGMEPLITAIRLPSNSFTQAGVAIIDTPGLDDPAATAGHHEKTALQWVVNEADFCILVHSSLAAPNTEMLGFVAKILARPSAPPLLILQNRFEARLWLRRDVSEGESRRQQEETRGRVVQALGDAADKVLIHEHHANFGLTADHRFRQTEVDAERLCTLGLQDDLQVVEDAVLALLKRDREFLKRQATVNRLRDFLSAEGGAAAAVAACRQSAQSVQQRFQSERRELDSVLERMKGLPGGTDERQLLGIKSVVRNQEGSWERFIHEESGAIADRFSATYGDGKANPFKGNFRDQIHGDEINEALKGMLEKAIARFGGLVFDRMGTFGGEVARELTTVCDQANGTGFKEANGVLAKFGLEGLPRLQEVERSTLPAIDLGNLNPKWAVENLILPFISARYNTREANREVDRVKKEVISLVSQRVKAYVETLARYAAENIQTQRAGALSQLVAQRTKHEERWAPQLLRAETAIIFADELAEELDAVRHLSEGIPNAGTPRLSPR